MISWRYNIVKVLWIHEPHLSLGDDLGFESAGLSVLVWVSDVTFLALSGGRKDLLLLLTSLVLGSVLFSIMANDIMAVYPNKNLLVNYTDDITIRSNFADLSLDEEQNIQRWSIENRMTLNLKKTWEMVVRGNTKKATHEGYWEEGGTQVIGSNVKRGAMQLGHASAWRISIIWFLRLARDYIF